MARADDEPWAALTSALLGDTTYTSRDVAETAGLDLEVARQLWRALGFPPVDEEARIFSEADVEIARGVRGLVGLQGADPADVMQLTRVIGRATGRIADAQVAAVAVRLEQAGADAAAGPADLVRRIEQLAPSLERFLGYVWRRHLLAAVRHRLAVPAAADRALTVGFADLVGFTALSQTLASHELAEIVDRFEAIAYEHIPEHGGWVVKMIGDEVMFAVDDGAFGADIAVALLDAYAREDALPDVRIGLARGPALSWEGDLFGPTVNVASRLVNLARPGTILVSDELGAALRDDPRFALRHLRAVRLQGLGRVRSWSLRRARV